MATAGAAIFDKLALDLSSSASIGGPVIQSVNVEPINLGAILEPQIGPAEAGGFLTTVPTTALWPSFGGSFTTAGLPEGFRRADTDIFSPEFGPQTKITRTEGISRSAVLFLGLAAAGAILLMR